MSKTREFLSSYKHVLVWTVCYVFIVWVVLRFLFNFDMFALRNWVRLAHIELHGFGGLAFGMFLLAAVPLYVATTVIVARNKTAPFTIPKPRWLQPEPKPEKSESESEIVQLAGREEIKLPDGAPKEMRESFLRARRNAGTRQYSVFNKPEVDKDIVLPKEERAEDVKLQSAPVVENEKKNTFRQAVAAVAPKINTNKKPTVVQDVASGLPLPENFDVDTGVAKSFDTPVFSDIKFDDDDDNDDDSEKNTDVAGQSDKISDTENFTQYMHGLGQDAKYQNGVFLSEKFAVAVHEDSDLWIADDIDWFAAGKQKPSPIVALKNAQEQYGVTPVLLLIDADIMDSDKLIPEWEKDGIKVAQNLDEFSGILVE